MTTTKIAGRQGKIRVGCTCPPNTTHEQCSCGATKMNVSDWSISPDIETTNFDSFDAGQPIAQNIEFSGEWCPVYRTWTVNVKQVMKRWRRKLAKKWRRYQHQKRKQ